MNLLIDRLANQVRRQSHYVVIRALNRGYPYMPNPFLYAVSTCFIKRLIFFNIVRYLLIGKLSKSYFCNAVMRTLSVIGSKTHRRNHLVGLT